jgi:hypothetical protein
VQGRCRKEGDDSDESARKRGAEYYAYTVLFQWKIVQRSPYAGRFAGVRDGVVDVACLATTRLLGANLAATQDDLAAGECNAGHAAA